MSAGICLHERQSITICYGALCGHEIEGCASVPVTCPIAAKAGDRQDGKDVADLLPDLA